MKKQLRNFERQWWDKRLVESQEAAERREFGSMYSLLRTRRYENEPSAIMQAVSLIMNSLPCFPVKKKSWMPLMN